MQIDLHSDIRFIKGIGPARAEAFSRVGVTSVYELITYYPRAYEDRSIVKKILDTIPGESCSIIAAVVTAPTVARIRGGMELLKFRVSDGSGFCEITFFNQSYLKPKFQKGMEFLFYGKFMGNLLARSLTNPAHEETQGVATGGRIVPIYPMTKGLSQKTITSAIGAVLHNSLPLLEEALSEEVRQQNQLVSFREALSEIHRPNDFLGLAKARDRLVFEEMLTLQLGLMQMKGRHRKQTGFQATEPVDMSVYYDSLSFGLTGAQKRATSEILTDMKEEVPMNRLLQGDVGSGKTAVAAAAAFFAARCGWQTAFLAPTEILAGQHYLKLSAGFDGLGIRVERLTGSMGKAQRKEVLGRLASGEIDILIGTHALLEDTVVFFKLGLMICDEQHRFGVMQRAKVTLKGNNPHILAMSATPIPRTLALMIYGDLDISVLDELPPGRMKIATHLVGGGKRGTVNKFILERMAQGMQGYIVCPLVEESENIKEELKDVKNYVKELQQVLPTARIGLLHGRLKGEEKDRVMTEFSAGRLDILVSTTVIEVGIDVPNANYIVIENAERFGLSQLHQLRGRVGRGTEKSYCILVSDSEGEGTLERLNTMCRTNDGFEIAQRDLELRGPGDFFGARQHGLPTLKLASLSADTRVLKAAQDTASEILHADPTLESAENAGLAAQVKRLFSLHAGNFLN